MKKLRFYVASRFENKDEVQDVQKCLINNGYELTYNWCLHEGTDLEKKKEYGINDLDGVRHSNFIVVCWPGRSGTRIEMGAALGLKIPIFILGCETPESMESHAHGTSVFWYHPLVHFCKDRSDLLNKIKSYEFI